MSITKNELLALLNDPEVEDAIIEASNRSKIRDEQKWLSDCGFLPSSQSPAETTETGSVQKSLAN